MSNKYKSAQAVPLQVLIGRLTELSSAITKGRESQEREFTMRIPAECDRDADIVLAESAIRLSDMGQKLEQAEAQIVDLICCSQDYMDAAKGTGKERIATRRFLEDCLKKIRLSQQADEKEKQNV